MSSWEDYLRGDIAWPDLKDLRERRTAQNMIAQRTYREKQMRMRLEYEARTASETRNRIGSRWPKRSSTDFGPAFGQDLVSPPEQRDNVTAYEPSGEVEPMYNDQSVEASQSHEGEVSYPWNNTHWRSIKEVGERRLTQQQVAVPLLPPPSWHEPSLQPAATYDQAHQSHWRNVKEVSDRRYMMQTPLYDTAEPHNWPQSVSTPPAVIYDHHPVKQSMYQSSNELRETSRSTYHEMEGRVMRGEIWTAKRDSSNGLEDKSNQPAWNTTHDTVGRRIRHQGFQLPEFRNRGAAKYGSGQLHLSATSDAGEEDVYTSTSVEPDMKSVQTVSSGKPSFLTPIDSSIDVPNVLNVHEADWRATNDVSERRRQKQTARPPRVPDTARAFYFTHARRPNDHQLWKELRRSYRERGNSIKASGDKDEAPPHTVVGTTTTANPKPAPNKALSNVKHGFSYQPIAANEMRLLKIEPGAHLDRICCVLVTVNPFEQDKWPEYESLSYCWRDDRDESETILVTDFTNHSRPWSTGTITVSATLLEALKRRRSLESWTVIWVDAICINQDDQNEKMQQIRLMQMIYRNANRVTIWLGEADPMTKDLLRHASASMLAKETPLRIIYGHPQDPLDSALQVTLLLELCQRPWFQRLWVVQELCLPKQAVIQYGDLQLPWDTLVAIIETVSEAAMKLNLTLKTIRLEATLSVLKSARVLWQGRDPSSPCTLLHQLGLLRGRACSIPADQIIGMLAICEDASVGDLNLNYEMPCEEVYAAATMHCINQGSLKVLSLCDSELSPPPGSGERKKLNSLPSWVPNWAQAVKPDSPTTFAIIIDGSKNRSRYNACGATQLRVDNNPAPNRLDLGGWIVSRIAHICPGNTDLDSLQELPFFSYRHQIKLRTASYLTRWYEAAFKFLGHKLSEDQEEAFWRTTCALSANDPRASSIRPLFDAWRRFDIGNHQPHWAFEVLGEEDYARYCDYIIRVDWVSRTRSFFITQDGRFGLASKTARVHDEVAVFSGGEVPSLLRPVPDGAYQLVGECYCNGIMDGEIPGRADHSPEADTITLC